MLLHQADRAEDVGDVVQPTGAGLEGLVRLRASIAQGDLLLLVEQRRRHVRHRHGGQADEEQLDEAAGKAAERLVPATDGRVLGRRSLVLQLVHFQVVRKTRGVREAVLRGELRPQFAGFLLQRAEHAGEVLEAVPCVGVLALPGDHLQRLQDVNNVVDAAALHAELSCRFVQGDSSPSAQDGLARRLAVHVSQVARTSISPEETHKVGAEKPQTLILARLALVLLFVFGAVSQAALLARALLRRGRHVCESQERRGHRGFRSFPLHPTRSCAF